MGFVSYSPANATRTAQTLPQARHASDKLSSSMTDKDASRLTRRRSTNAAASAAGAVLNLAGTRETYEGTIKDASHGAFYAGAAKGFASALDGLLLFLSRAELRARLQDDLTTLFSSHLWYAALAAAVVIFVRSRADDIGQMLWTFSRWARIVTVAMTFLLERKQKATEAMFFDALKARHPEFAAAVHAQPPIKKSTQEKYHKYKRIAKMAAFRFAGTIVAYVVPGGKLIVIPLIKFVTMRPILGGPVASAVAAIHILPDSILGWSHLGDVLMSFSEAVIDAADLGNDSIKAYAKRLDSEKTREYFRERYRGYMSGMGFFYSVLMQVPFLGIPLLLIAQCGAAVMVVDIVQRNLDKEVRLPLTGEAVFVRERAATTHSAPTKDI